MASTQEIFEGIQIHLIALKLDQQSRNKWKKGFACQRAIKMGFI